MPTTALIAAGIGAAGSIGSSLISSNAATNASNASLAQQKQMFGVAQGALDPYVKAGQGAIPTLQGLLTPGANQSKLLAQTPGFQFASQYGTMAATNAAAAHGTASGGPLAAAISQYNNGLAQSTWQSTINGLQNLTNTGANSAGNLAGGAITSGANMGNTVASGILGSANALTGGITGATNSGSNALLYSQLFGGNAGGGGLYTPSQIAKLGGLDASTATDAQANAYGTAMGLV